MFVCDINKTGSRYDGFSNMFGFCRMVGEFDGIPFIIFLSKHRCVPNIEFSADIVMAQAMTIFF